MRKIFKFDSVNSTNDLLSLWADDPLISTGSIIWALNQYNGRGQHGNIWECEPNTNLTFSVLIRHEKLHAMDQFSLNKSISLSLIKSLYPLSNNLSIKWPNDIFIYDKKIAGILIENSIKGNYIDYSIVGIGINVNQTIFPDNLKNASSIINETGQRTDLDELLNSIAKNIEEGINNFHNEGDNRILETYLSNLYKKDEISVFRKDHKNFNGIIRGVDKYGKILIELENDDIVSFSNGEIKMMI